MKKIYLNLLKLFRIVINIIIIFLPWNIRRYILNKIYKYQIGKGCHIGLAYIYPKTLIMEDGSIIKHFNIAINLDSIILKKNALIDRSNWITGFPTETNSAFFKGEKERKSQLLMGENSVITKKHHFDCTNEIKIGNFATIAGYNSQFLTHSINPYSNRQESKPIQISDYSFISTNVIVLGGSYLPPKSILGAGAVLNKNYAHNADHGLYVGVPAYRKKEIDKDALYFKRKKRDVF